MRQVQQVLERFASPGLHLSGLRTGGAQDLRSHRTTVLHDASGRRQAALHPIQVVLRTGAVRPVQRQRISCAGPPHQSDQGAGAAGQKRPQSGAVQHLQRHPTLRSAGQPGQEDRGQPVERRPVRVHASVHRQRVQEVLAGVAGSLDTGEMVRQVHFGLQLQEGQRGVHLHTEATHRRSTRTPQEHLEIHHDPPLQDVPNGIRQG